MENNQQNVWQDTILLARRSKFVGILGLSGTVSTIETEPNNGKLSCADQLQMAPFCPWQNSS